MNLKYQTIKLITSGKYCDVYHAKELTTEKEVIIKECSKFRLKKLKLYGYSGKMSGLDLINNEISILKEIGHPYNHLFGIILTLI